MPVRRPWFLLLVGLLIGNAMDLRVPAFAQDPQTDAIPMRITTAVDESSLVTLYGNVHPLATTSVDNGPAPVSMEANRLLLVLSRSMKQEADLQTYLQSVQDQNSPNYHKFLNPNEFGQRFGVGNDDLQMVEGWLTGHGFTVNKVPRGHTAIEFSGTAGQLQNAFHTSLHSYSINGQKFWANAADPQIPSALAPLVAGIATLNSFKPKAQYIRGPSGFYDPQSHTVTATYTIGDATNGYYILLGPADAATIYNAPTTLNPNRAGTAYDGTGVTIGVAGDSNIDLTQNANYRATFGLPAKGTSVVIDGADPGKNGDAIEAYLDTQIAGGLAPNANIILYTAADTTYQSGLLLAIERAIDDNQADILNVSFGNCEAVLGAAGNQLMNSLWEQAAAQGIAVTVSSGDSGSAGCDDSNVETAAVKGLAVNGIGSTPYNISVGGTDYDILYSNFPTSFSTYVDLTNTLPNHRSALQYIPEEPWNDSTLPNTSILQNVPISVASHYASPDNIIAAGGGISTVYPAPTWQSGFGSSNGRSLPDVSLLAGNGFYGAGWGICTDLDTDASGKPVADCAAGAAGNNFYLTGIGGTSAAAPAFAGMLALVEQKMGSRLGQVDYSLYHLAKSNYSTVFHDVVTGDNAVECSSGSPNCQAVTEVNTYYLSGYNAAAGYDEASGLGSVNATQMTGNWANAGFIATSSLLQLNGAATALSITHGQSVTVTASVTSSGGTPSGNISLVDNLSPASRPSAEGLAGLTLSGGAASGTTTSLPGGVYLVSAHYGGDTTFAESDSNSIPVTVAPESSTTTLKVTGYYDPATGKAATTPYYGFVYFIDAQPYGNSASAASPDGTPTGSITFKSGSATIGTAVLSSQGIAELQTATLSGGNNNLTATFPGDSSFQASTSAPVAFNVTPAVTSLNLNSSVLYSVVAGAPVTFNVTLAADSVGAAPTGKVTFQDGSTSLGTAPLSGTVASGSLPAGGTATFTSSTLVRGAHTITAVYSGDGNYGKSVSSAVSLTILPADVSMVEIPPSTLTPINQPVPVIVNLYPAIANGLQAPTGTITLTYNGNTSPPVNVSNWTATVTIPANSLPVGSTSVTANYSGDQYYGPDSTSGSVNMKGSGTLKPNITVTAPTGTANYPVTVTVAVGGASGDPIATGTVSMTGGNWGSSSPLINGLATFVIKNNLFGGSNTLTATYLGDNNYSNGTGTGVVRVLATPNVYFPFANPGIVVNQALNVTVDVANPGNNLPAATGTITLSSGTYTSSPVQLSAGGAQLTIPANSLAVGNDTLTASYSGDSNYSPGSGTEIVNVSPVPNPGLTLTGTNVTFVRGATTGNTSTITLTPSGGFTGSVTLTATITGSPSGAQDLPTMSFGSTNPASITGTANVTATLTISTTAATNAGLAYPQHPSAPWYLRGGLALACILIFGIPVSRRRWRNALGLLALFIAIAGGVLACGGGGGGGGVGGGNPGTTAGAYTITVNGTSGTISAKGTVTVTVQ